MHIPLDPEEMNEERAATAERTLDYFTVQYGEVAWPKLALQNLTDMLCNLAHYCDRHNLQLSDALQRAATHYDAETESTGTQSFSVQ